MIIDRTVEKFERIDCLIANAGISMGDLFETVSQVDIFETLMRVNFMQNVWLCHYALKYLIAAKNSGPNCASGARINAVSSIAGAFGTPLRTGYSASKFALEGFYKSLRCELVPYGIKITITRPGPTESNILTRLLGPDGVVGHASFTQSVAPSELVSSRACAEAMLDATERGDLDCQPNRWLFATMRFVDYFFPDLTPIICRKMLLRALAANNAANNQN